MATPWLAAGLAVPALFLLGGGSNKGDKDKKKLSSRGEGLVDLDEFDRYEEKRESKIEKKKAAIWMVMVHRRQRRRRRL